MQREGSLWHHAAAVLTVKNRCVSVSSVRLAHLFRAAACVIRAVHHVLFASMLAVLRSSERGWYCVSHDHRHHVRRTTVLHKP
jgi:hypothetical protein